MFDSLIGALPAVLQTANLISIVVGVIMGIFVGAMPGLGATMAISVLIPFTFGLDPLVALGMMAGIYNGAMYGGSISAVLLRIPGTPAAVATSFDGYPMAMSGRASEALHVAVVSSAVGGMVSALSLMLLAPPLARVTLAFGPPEVFWVAVFGLASIALLMGKNPVKGLLSACIGLTVSLVGVDNITGYDRFTFGNLELAEGVNIVVLLVGLYALPPAFGLLEDADLKMAVVGDRKLAGSLLSSIPKMLGYWKTWVRGSLIGIFVGILPGAGGSLAAFLSYNEGKRAAKDPDSWGQGNPEGVAAAEVANNADTSAAMIPALTLGIPGTPVAALVLGGLLIHGMQPGPMLFREHPQVVYGFMIQLFISAALLLAFGGTVATRVFAKVLHLPRPVLAAMVLSLMVVGVYAINTRMFDVYLMFGFGLLGYAMERLGMPLAPAVLGLILGEYAEFNLRLSLRMSRSDWSILWTRPICLVIIALILAVFLWPLISGYLARRKAARRAAGVQP